MNISERKEHWENVYQTKRPDEVSWTQTVPQTSLDFIRSFNLPKTAKIIDVGGGDSRLADHLLAEGFENITVLDISEKALERSKQRLGEKADLIRWIVSDITDFTPEGMFDVWHDRAVFHFLTAASEIEQYISTARQSITPNGFITIATFSDHGPTKCSGLDVHQYTDEMLTKELHNGFEKIRCITEDHITPFNTKQNFLFCSFRRC